jgi:hypothetical protein
MRRIYVREMKRDNMRDIKEQKAYNEGIAVGCIIVPTIIFAIVGVCVTIRWLLL